MFIKNIRNAVESIGRSIDKPIFIKEYRDQSGLINELDQIKMRTNDNEVIKSIEIDQLLIKQGDIGEKAICYEIEKSMIPMLCLHDLCITYEGQTAQIDFVLITNKFISVLESKKLSGDITINSEGQFTRSFKNAQGKIYKKEAIYSPITQNERHIALIHKFLLDKRLIKYAPVISFVVLANPKSIINSRYAKKAIKEKIVRGDQLVSRLKGELKKKSDIKLSVVSMENIAQALLNVHKEKEQKFVSKYEKYVGDTEIKNEAENFDVSNQNLYETLLKEYRLNKSREMKIKAYMIYNNDQMKILIDAMPKEIDDLIHLKGFGPKKIELFGKDIINILNSN